MAVASPAQTLTTLHSFAGQPNDGANPDAGLVQGSDGNFYGTTYSGGANNKGTVFTITPNGSVTILHSFTGSDGREPTAGLIQASDGNLYGTTSFDGTGGPGGTVFKITPNGTLTTLATFNGQGGPEFPYAGLIQGRDGNFYGTTTAGGTHFGNGTVFQITPNGTVTTLHSFACTDGCAPFSGLVQGNDGNFYGTTRSGGTNGNNYGTVFRITANGTFTLLHTFEGSDGGDPYASLVQATDGNFYGTTTSAGAHGAGTIFKITASGTLTTLYNFCAGGYPCADGEAPYAGLMQTDGNFYGTTQIGGTNNVGTVFQITPSGTLTTLHSFAVSDGAKPYAGVIQATDRNFYGTTYTGGNASGDGTVFKLTPLTSTTTVLTSTPNPSEDGQLVTLTATVGPAGPPTPTGTVGFTSNGAAISGCTAVTLGSSRTAVCTTTGLAVGTDAIVATYSGDTNYSGSSGTLSQLVNPIPSPLQFVAVTPCRLVDTRPPNGSGPILGGTFQNFPIPQEGGCNIPTSAVAYSLNVSVVPQHSLGYLTIWPAGEGRPVVATLNSLDGRIKANAAIVPAGANGAVSIYVTDTTNVILDINGYFAPVSGSTLAFYPLAPCRVADTRSSSYPQGLGPPFPAWPHGTAIPHSECHELQHSFQRRGLFAQLLRGSPRRSGLSDGLAHGPDAAAGLNLERCAGNDHRQRGACARGRERQSFGVSVQ